MTAETRHRRPAKRASHRRRPGSDLRTAVVVALAIFAASIASADRGRQSSEAARWLQQYLQIDTSNPPGRELGGASYLRQILHQEGIPTRLLVTPEGRASLYARLEARDPSLQDPAAQKRPTSTTSPPNPGALVLLHHIDVVPPGPGWDTSPFGGEVENGRLWGRGALDDKSLGIAHLAAFVELKRRRVELERDVIFLAVADEERGGRLGTAWILEQFPALLDGVAAVLGEGGSNRAFQGRVHWWGIEVAQKRPLWLELTATGRGGHGSTLNLHTAPHRLIRGLDLLLDRPLEYRVSAATRQYFEAVAPLESPKFQGIVADLDEIVASTEPARRLLPGLPNYLLDTVQINTLAAGEKVNVAPETATARIDIRLLPETDAEAYLAEVRRLLGKEVEVQVLLEAPPAEASPVDHPVFRCLADTLGRTAPVVPTFIPGITDSRYFRQLGVPAYGLSPFVLEGSDLKGIHGADERIPIAAFEDGVERMVDLVATCAGR